MSLNTQMKALTSVKILQSNLYIPNGLFKCEVLHGDQGNKNREKMSGFTPIGLGKTRQCIPVMKEKK